MAESKTKSPLSPYRVLDLTDEKGLQCGKLLGDLGADVIKIERPGGDPARSLGPFYHDEPDPEKSLFWFAFNTNKRGITLNIETVDGREVFQKLVSSADFLIESFPLGYLDRLGLGYSSLEKIKPGLIMVSITPFGQTGPYKDYQGPDIVEWALGGQTYTWGDADRPPIRISHHSHAYLHASTEAAVAAMGALYHRHLTGEGEYIDISIQESIVQNIVYVTPWWDMMKIVETRKGVYGVRLPQVWPCQDGFVLWSYFGGAGAGWRNRPLIEWMKDQGGADEFLVGIDWEKIELRNTTQEVIDKIKEPTIKFFMSHTKAELVAGAIKYQAMIYPCATTEDVLKNEQLAARGFWTKLEHPELGTTITYPGPFVHTTGVAPNVCRRAPLIGEHNEEIYSKEFGISKEELAILKQANVI